MMLKISLKCIHICATQPLISHLPYDRSLVDPGMKELFIHIQVWLFWSLKPLVMLFELSSLIRSLIRHSMTSLLNAITQQKSTLILGGDIHFSWWGPV